MHERSVAGEWGYPLDDSWIHAVMARNLATGHGFSFNPGEPVAGSTGPLYTALLAACYAVTREVVWTGKILGLLCHLGASLFVMFAVRRLVPDRPWLPLLAAALVATSPPLVWGALSGMELSLYLLLVCAGFHAWVSDRPVLATACWSAGIWVRPDGFFLLALSFFFVRGRLWRRVLVAAVVVAGYAAFNEIVGGRLLPQTVAMKAHFGMDLHARTWNMLREWATLWGVPYRRNDEVNEPVVFLLLLLAGAALTWRRRPLLALYVIGFPLALSLFRDSAGSHKRYLLPTVPFAMTLVALSVDRAARWFESRGARHALAAGTVVILAGQAPYLEAMRTAYAWNVQNIEKMQVLLGRFAKLATVPGDRIATNDIGAIGYFSGRYVVDLLGLVSPLRPLPENLRIHRPKLLLVFLTWFRDDAEPDSASGNYRFWDADSTHRYELVAGVELERNTICANNRMTAYIRLGKNDPSPTRRWLYRY